MLLSVLIFRVMTEKDKEEVQSMIDKAIYKLLYIIFIPIGILIYFLLDSLAK